LSVCNPEQVAKEHSVLVFCSTKVQVENVAKSLVSRKSEPPDVRLAERRSALVQHEPLPSLFAIIRLRVITDMSSSNLCGATPQVDDLKASGTLITSSLKAMIGAGVSFHHGVSINHTRLAHTLHSP
jgi:hypothetical protein